MTSDNDRREIWMTMESFSIRELQNHYPSGSTPQNCSAVIQVNGLEMRSRTQGDSASDQVEIDDLEVTSTAREAWITFKNFPLQERVIKQPTGDVVRWVEDVPAPFIGASDDILRIFHPYSSLPLWQMILTELPRKYFLKISNNSHSFVGAFPDSSIPPHHVGGTHPSA